MVYRLLEEKFGLYGGFVNLPQTRKIIRENLYAAKKKTKAKRYRLGRFLGLLRRGW